MEVANVKDLVPHGQSYTCYVHAPNNGLILEGIQVGVTLQGPSPKGRVDHIHVYKNGGTGYTEETWIGAIVDTKTYVVDIEANIECLINISNGIWPSHGTVQQFHTQLNAEQTCSTLKNSDGNPTLITDSL